MLQRCLPAPAHLHRVLCILGRLALHKSALRWVGKSGCLPQQTAWGKAVRGVSGCALRDACVRANGAGEHSRRRYTYLSAPNTYDEYAVPRSPAVSAAIARSTRERPCEVIAAAAGVCSLSDCGSSGGSNCFRCSCSDVLRFRSLARSLVALRLSLQLSVPGVGRWKHLCKSSAAASSSPVCGFGSLGGEKKPGAGRWGGKDGCVVHARSSPTTLPAGTVLYCTVLVRTTSGRRQRQFAIRIKAGTGTVLYPLTRYILYDEQGVFST